MLDQTNFVGFLIVPGIVHVACDWLEERSVRRRCIAAPLDSAALFKQEVTRFFVWVVTDRRREVARREHRAAEREPFIGTLLGIRLIE
jgi:hypothetical protein